MKPRSVTEARFGRAVHSCQVRSRPLQAWVFNRTGSLIPVALVHAAADATAAGSIAGAGLLDRLYPGDGADGLVFPILGALGLVAIAATRGRLGRHAPARAVESPDRGEGRQES